MIIPGFAMENILVLTKTKGIVKNSLLDIIAVAFIYFIPAISHMFSFPVYIFEPMRIMLILSIAHSTKKNAYLIALTLPLFSFLTASHPVFIKGLLMTTELTLNVWLFYLLSKKMANIFYAVLLSIILSKMFYYLGKFLLIQLSLFKTDLVDTPLLIQAGITIVFSGYIYLIWKRQSKNTA